MTRSKKVRKMLRGFLATVGVLGMLLIGCSQGPLSTAPEVKSPSTNTSLMSSIPSSTVFAADSPSAKESPLEKSHKEYLQAYEKYVQTLRESGPQTLETLYALADYQKKYQIYQMVLNAQSGGKKE
mgnify:CR=1 FL=1